jgi:hypothetical protein
MTRRLLAAAALVLVTATASPARAEIPEILREAEGRAFWAALSLGPALGMYGITSQFKLSQTFGWHFTGGPTGPAIALDLSEAFGGGYVTIDVAPRFVWDIHIIKGLGLYLSPSAGLGFSYSTWGSCVTTAGGGNWCPNQSWTAFHFTMAFDAKLILANRWLVMFRPMGLDGYVHPNGWAMRYSILFAGGAIF